MLELAATPSSYAEWYSATSADEPMPQVWPVTEVRRPRSAIDIAGEIAWRPTFQIGMLLVTLLVIAGVAFKLVLRFRQSRPLDPRLMPDEMPVQRTTVRGLGDRNSGAGARHDRDALPPITPTDPARDLKKSLAELMADLRRARTPPYSPRSFAPRKLSAIYQKSRSARDLLPPIDGWGEARAGVAAPAEKKRHWSAPVRAHALSDLPETSLSAGPSLVPA